MTLLVALHSAVHAGVDEPFLPQWATRTAVLAMRDTSSTFVEVADVNLYGVDGLRLSGARGRQRFGRYVASLSAARLGTPAGAASRYAVGAGLAIHRHVFELRFNYDALAIDGAAPDASVSVDVWQRTDVTDAWSVSVAATDFGTSGTSGMNLVAVSRFDAQAVFVDIGVEVHRSYGAGGLVSASFRRLGRMGLAIAYDGLAHVPGATLSVAAGHITVSGAVRLHPVLGISQGVSVSWGR